MPEKLVFADEAGCFTFKRKNGASRYFILCSATMSECTMSNELLSIRRRLVAKGEADRDKLHATSDSQSTRDEVFSVLAKYDFRVDCTILEKAKAQPQTRVDEPTFYKYAWFFHLKHVAPKLLSDGSKLLITAAALGTKKTKAVFKEAVNNSVQQVAPRDRWEVAFLDSAKDPGLWVADYCAWAIQRKWEVGDERSYALIADRIHTEFDLWKRGEQTYY